MNKQEFIERFQHARQVIVEQDYPLKIEGKPAAVLIPVVLRNDALTLLLTKRAQHLRHHPGQISFPGGRIESTDFSAREAALREAKEEIGLAHNNVEWIGELTAYRTISQYRMLPFVGFVEPQQHWKLDDNEVEELIEVPLEIACNPKNHLVQRVNRDGMSMPIYFIPINGHLIWGATAALIRNLSHHLYG